jgi:hypothetical protein
MIYMDCTVDVGFVVWCGVVVSGSADSPNGSEGEMFLGWSFIEVVCAVVDSLALACYRTDASRQPAVVVAPATVVVGGHRVEQMFWKSLFAMADELRFGVPACPSWVPSSLSAVSHTMSGSGVLVVDVSVCSLRSARRGL